MENKKRPASAETIAKVSVKLKKLISETRVAVVRGDVTPHKGKFKASSGADYLNKIVHLVELDIDSKGNLTEQDLQLNVNWNNGMAARLPKGGLKKGDVLFGFETCDDRFVDGPARAIFPGKMGIIRHAANQREATRATRVTAVSKSNPVDVRRVLKMYRKDA